MWLRTSNQVAESFLRPQPHTQNYKPESSATRAGTHGPGAEMGVRVFHLSL